MDFSKLIEKYDFETGDIILYERINQYNSLSDYLFNFVDWGIRYFTKSKYSHVAMIIKNPPWNKELKGYFIIESNHETIEDSEDHEIKTGVELIPLEKVLESTSDHIYWRKLHCIRDQDFYKKLIQVHSVIHNRPYDLIITDWFKAWKNITIGNVHRKKTFWCSELVSYIYHMLGFLGDIPWTIISPCQLGTEHKNHLRFKNCKVDKEIKII